MLRSGRSWIAVLTAGVLAGTTAVLGGCGTDPAAGQSASGVPPAVAKAKAGGTAVDPAIVQADNTFGLNLLNALQQQMASTSSAPTDIAMSPLSGAIALQVLYNGAAGSTQQAMGAVLQLGALDVQQVNDDNAALQASLIGADPKVQLTIANSLWIHAGSSQVSMAFTQTDQQYYGATVGDLAGAPDTVNAWIASQTGGLITNVLPPADYSHAVAVIVNAVYFKGQWTTAFDVSKTTPAPFSAADGTTVTVQMMHQSGTYEYLAGANFQMIRLPYGQGRMSMLIVLPDNTTTLEAFVAGLTPNALDSSIAQMQSTNVDVALPRFISRYTAKLNPPLTTLGMGIAFQCPLADFTPAFPPGTCITDSEQATMVEVDEAGTVAAASTTVTIGIEAVPSMPTMTMDHPFFYAIRDDDTGELLFLGTVQNPSS